MRTPHLRRSAASHPRTSQPGVPVQPGDGFTSEQRAELAHLLASADAATGLSFRLRVGGLAEGRTSAEDALAAEGVRASDTVLIAIDPGSRVLEIVTGTRAAARLTDRSCALAALAMTSSFSAGDLVGGIRNGIQVLGDHAAAQPTLHLDTF
ncbi:MAG: DUF5130 family protein [Actinobacteria bacterium]|nr:DUF5130 family protein [Actinomycetota bacterium]